MPLTIFLQYGSPPLSVPGAPLFPIFGKGWASRPPAPTMPLTIFLQYGSPPLSVPGAPLFPIFGKGGRQNLRPQPCLCLSLCSTVRRRYLFRVPHSSRFLGRVGVKTSGPNHAFAYLCAVRFAAVICSGCPTLPDFWEGWASKPPAPTIHSNLSPNLSTLCAPCKRCAPRKRRPSIPAPRPKTTAPPPPTTPHPP